MESPKERILELVQQLQYYTHLYDMGWEEISDTEYDKLYYELVELEKRFPEYILSNSPTQSIQYTVVNGLRKVIHSQPMLSLDKTKDVEKVKDFTKNKHWIAMLKLDGLTCRLTYEGGRLIRAETRGNGIEGEDITHNARVLPSIPQVIDYTDTFIVDGEIICDLNTFKQFENKYANARNFAAGSIRLLDSNQCARRGLTFVAWDIIQGSNSEYLSERLEDLTELFFITVPYSTNRIYNIFAESTIDLLKEISNERNYPIDGIVIKYDNCLEYQEAGSTAHHPNGAIAYKFYDEEYETTLQNIEWSMGKTGVLSPVAIYASINIDGAVCNRANLHNINTLVDILGEYPIVGQTIWVYRANQIIPQISHAAPAEEILGVDPAYYLSDSEVQFLLPPKVCPICGAPTEIRESGSGTIELYCSSDECEGKLINRLEHFCGKKGLDIKGLSEATLGKLIDWTWVDSIKSLFELRQYRHIWVGTPGFGPKSVDRILDAIDEARNCTLENFLSAISIPLIGRTFSKELAKTFGSYEAFRAAIKEDFDFTAIEGIGPEKHEALISFDYSEADEMVAQGIIRIAFAAQVDTTQLEGLTFVITGKVHRWKNRDELKRTLEARGAKVVESVSSKTNYLINNDVNSTSAKSRKAKELGIPILTEEELAALLEN